MAFLERTPGGWRVVWRTGGRGSPRKKSPTFPKQHQAKEFKAKIEQDQAAIKPLIAGKPPLTWDELVARYREHHREATADHLAKFAQVLAKIARERKWASVADVTPSAIAGLRVHQARHLRALLHFAETQDQPFDRRVLLAAKPKAPRRTPSTLLTDQRVAELIAAATSISSGHGALVHLVATYGHRVESLIHLCISDYDQTAGTLTLPVKSGDTHRHPITAATRKILDGLVRDAHGLPHSAESPLLPAHGRTAWTTATQFCGWWRTIGKSGEGILDLRRYAITRMLGLGLDPKTVASITGHRTVSLLLNTYSRTSADRQTAAMEAMEKLVTPR
jgi:integrase